MIDSSSNEGLKPDDMNGMIELKNVKFHYPSREEVPVISRNVLLVMSNVSSVIINITSMCCLLDICINWNKS